ncbi:GntR family transcriptional regulator [Cupriavidus sp. TA19]|uniref:GntR family transcriptional regulator n=1 Tax=unclassified Cupriavidus TaxID=2640874 RepID=UPI000E2E48AB|nr:MULTISPECIES: GntR family transcriptional regulator [unclassified Cupriavidus]BDB30692.1 GntR family transcriptional regulator [Cupriavidus sp. P-10]GLC91766.1 GntR family transcriptional regulator [Cupriavidus sp. TA19]
MNNAETSQVLGSEVRARQRGDGANKALEILRILRARIAKQDLLPGAKVREQDLAEEFDVPRPLVREVFAALAQRGLIERIPNRGAVVTRIDLQQLLHIYDVREVLDGLCVRLATQNVPPESWQDLVDFFNGPMVQYVEESNLDAFIDGYDFFRRRVIEAAANPPLAEMLDSIWDKTQFLIRRIIILPGRPKQGLAEHSAVLNAMRAGDAAAAEALRRKNFQSAKKTLSRYQKYLV